MSLPSVADRARIPFARTEIGRGAWQAVRDVLDSGWITTGPQVARFEEEFARRVGAESAVAVSSCTTGIELALRALHLPRGAKVLTSTVTFCGAVNAIVHAGLRPVLVDVDEGTLMPDAATTAAAVRRVGGVDAMTVVHYGGHPAPVDALARAAELPPDRVVEDAAHALGTWVGDRPVGSGSAAACFSFYATKNLPIGEGGMVTTGRPELADFVRRARLHGMSRDAWKRYLPGNRWAYTVEEIGLKANMTDLQAAIGLAQLPHFEAWQRRREDLARAYGGRLGRIPGISIPAEPSDGRHAWHLYAIQVDAERFGMDRDAFIEGLGELGIDCSVHFIPLHRMPYIGRVAAGGSASRLFPGAEAAFGRIVSLPLYPSLSDDELDRVCAAVEELHADAGRPVPRSRR